MISLQPFKEDDFSTFISWLDNEKLLATIAGNYFTYPLTHRQLSNYIAGKNSVAFSIFMGAGSKPVGHAEIIIVSEQLCKIDKLIIGDPSSRGKGLGGQIIEKLLDYCFNRLHAEQVELNVYDWNAGAIKCYTQAGFTDTGKRLQTTVQDEQWMAINMIKHKNDVYEK